MHKKSYCTVVLLSEDSQGGVLELLEVLKICFMLGEKVPPFQSLTVHMWKEAVSDVLVGLNREAV